MLPFRIWYFLAKHFVSRGWEFHHQLSIRSLKFERDENCIEYVTISYERHLKTHQGGLEETNEEANDKKMYATGTPSCPVQSLKLYMSKTDPNALSLFNECNKESRYLVLQQICKTQKVYLI